MPEDGESGRLSPSREHALALGMVRYFQMRADRLAPESGLPVFDPLSLNPLVQMLEFPSGGLLERVRTRFHSMSIFWRYQTLISRHCRGLTDSRLEAVRRGEPLLWETVVWDDRYIRTALRKLRLALFLFLLGYRKAVDMGRASQAELNRLLSSPE